MQRSRNVSEGWGRKRTGKRNAEIIPCFFDRFPRVLFHSVRARKSALLAAVSSKTYITATPYHRLFLYPPFISVYALRKDRRRFAISRTKRVSRRKRNCDSPFREKSIDLSRVLARHFPTGSTRAFLLRPVFHIQLSYRLNTDPPFSSKVIFFLTISLNQLNLPVKRVRYSPRLHSNLKIREIVLATSCRVSPRESIARKFPHGQMFKLYYTSFGEIFPCDKRGRSDRARV